MVLVTFKMLRDSSIPWIFLVLLLLFRLILVEGGAEHHLLLPLIPESATDKSNTSCSDTIKAELGDSWKVQEYPKSRSLEQRIFRSLSGVEVDISTTPLDPLTTEFKKLQEELASLRAMNDPYGIYTRLPFNLRID